MSLVYRAWSKYRHGVVYRKQGQDDFTRRMFCAVGLDGFGSTDTELHPFYYLKFAPLLASKSRAAYTLWLERNLQHAELVLFDSIDDSFDGFVSDGLDVLAGLKPRLLEDQARLVGSTILG